MNRLTPISTASRVTTVVILGCAVAATFPLRAQQAPRTGQVVGSRSFSPIVADVDAAMKIYAALGLTVPPPASGTSYPWDDEAWHYDLHGGEAPGSQMRFAYATVPGAVHRQHRCSSSRSSTAGTEAAHAARAGSRSDHVGARGPRSRPRGTAAARRIASDGPEHRLLREGGPGHDHRAAWYASRRTAAAGSGAREHRAGRRQHHRRLGAGQRRDLDKTLALYRDEFGLAFRTAAPTDAEFGGVVASGGSGRARLRLAPLPCLAPT